MVPSGAPSAGQLSQGRSSGAAAASPKGPGWAPRPAAPASPRPAEGPGNGRKARSEGGERGSRAAPLPAPPPRPRRGHGPPPGRPSPAAGEPSPAPGGGRGSPAGRRPPRPVPLRSALLPRREKGQRCPNKAIGSQELLPKITPRSPASASGPFYEGGKRHIPPPPPPPGQGSRRRRGWESKCLLKIEPGKGQRRSPHTARPSAPAEEGAVPRSAPTDPGGRPGQGTNASGSVFRQVWSHRWGNGQS